MFELDPECACVCTGWVCRVCVCVCADGVGLKLWGRKASWMRGVCQ